MKPKTPREKRLHLASYNIESIPIGPLSPNSSFPVRFWYYILPLFLWRVFSFRKIANYFERRYEG